MKAAIIFLLGLVALIPQTVRSQTPSELTFNGHVTINHQNCEGAEVSVCKTSAASDDCTETERLTTKKNGRFDLILNADNVYEIHVKKDGFSECIIQINTSIGNAEIDASRLIFEFDVDLTLYSEKKNPFVIASVYFDAAKGKFDYRSPTQ